MTGADCLNTFPPRSRTKWLCVATKAKVMIPTGGIPAATAQPKYQHGYEPLPEGFRYVPYNDIEALEAIMSEKTCAVMIEPIQGEGGINIADILKHNPSPVLSIELPHLARVKEFGTAEHACRCIEAARKYVTANTLDAATAQREKIA